MDSIASHGLTSQLLPQSSASPQLNDATSTPTIEPHHCSRSSASLLAAITASQSSGNTVSVSQPSVAPDHLTQDIGRNDDDFESLAEVHILYCTYYMYIYCKLPYYCHILVHLQLYTCNLHKLYFSIILVKNASSNTMHTYHCLAAVYFLI